MSSFPFLATSYWGKDIYLVDFSRCSRMDELPPGSGSLPCGSDCMYVPISRWVPRMVALASAAILPVSPGQWVELWPAGSAPYACAVGKIIQIGDRPVRTKAVLIFEDT